MANIGTNLGDAISDIIRWLGAAIKKVGALIQAGDTQNAALLLADIQTVVTAYLQVIKGFFPDNVPDKAPSNFFAKIAWIIKYTSWVNVLIVALTGVNPFDGAKAQAAAIAAKWGF